MNGSSEETGARRQAPARPRPALRRVRSTVARVAKTWMLRGGVMGALRTVRPSRKLGVLRYHAICGPEGFGYADPSICISAEAFERHVQYLVGHYRVLDLPAAVSVLRRGGTLPANAVAITFDDGYADNLHASRVLHRHGVNGTFYITSGCLAGGEPFWPSEIRSLVAAIPGRRFTLTAAGERLELSHDTPAERQAALRQLARLFKSHPIAIREDLREQLRRLARHAAYVSPMLTWDQLAEMHGLGMTIGAHTVTHPNLPSAGLEDAEREIAGSKAQLERALGVPITMFSYPNGGAERYFTPDVQRLVRTAGFEASVTSRNGFAGAHSDLYALERVQVAERLEDLVFALEVERFAFAPTS
jgi:peptidoglycan/xylan/chitin deacetylase (PgdA/CDA1 family)